MYIGDIEVVRQALATVFGEAKAGEILESTKLPEVKKHLNDNTALALEKGAFGVPWFVCEDAEGREEVFFGVDRLGMVAEFLGVSKEKKEVGFRALL